LGKETFSFLEITKNDSLKDFSDLQLARLAQKDIDQYRRKCRWSCKTCGNTISYIDSLVIKGEAYVHEARCPGIKDNGKKCNRKMELIRKDDTKFDSIYFSELFSRYQNMMAKQGYKFQFIDSVDEIYSFVAVQFFKIISQFARREMEETSEKWFSSFLWKSVQNRIFDLNKTNNYLKRSAGETCAICGSKMVTINKKHLMQPGHKRLKKEILICHGMSLAESSSLSDEEYLGIGRRSYRRGTAEVRDKITKDNCVKAYIKMFPRSAVKNSAMSFKDLVADEENDSNVEDMFSDEDSVFGDKKDNSMMNRFHFNDSIKEITENLTRDHKTIVKSVFVENISFENRKKIVGEIIAIKAENLFKDEENNVVDKYFKEVREGATDKIFKTIRGDKKYRILLRSGFLTT
jgi:hypothetical protein